MPDEPHTSWVASENLTDEQVEEARGALETLIKIISRATVDACHRLGIEFDMDDPEAARDVMNATFEGLFYSKPTPLGRVKDSSKAT